MDRFKTTLAGAGAICLVFFFLSSRAALAAAVTTDTAANAVQGWLRQDHGALGGKLSAKVKRTDAIKDAAGDTIYYVVRLEPAGYVIVSADDLAEPVVAFSASGNFDASSASPVAALVNRDLPRRAAGARARARAGGAAVGTASKARAKWQAFLAGSPNPPPDVEENGNIVVASQIWVAPLTQTLWSQTVDVNETSACYNYYTPTGPAGSTNNYPCGCVATAMAQEMYFFQYPTSGVGTKSFAITVDGVASNASLLGGPYQWTNMPLSPNLPTAPQAMAIGALTHDAGVSVSMKYTANNSAALTANVPVALTNTFMYASAAYYEDDNNGITGSNLLNMINPNLDARMPVILGVQPSGGHCLLVDGYGYSASTLFHHINAGFGGDDDIWYALPDVNTVDGNGSYAMIAACVYNIYTTGNGQIISGRVTDPTGAPVAGASVSAVKSGGGNYSATTDSNGVYALARIPANSSYTLTVSNAGCTAVTGNFSTGASAPNQLPSGNVWGANFVLATPLLAVPETGFAAIGPVGGPFNVLAQIYTLTNTSASAVTCKIANTNTWLIASATNGSLAAGAASNLTVALAPGATNLPDGSYSGSVWITNLGNGFAQQLTFSLAVKTADYPMAVTGYNLDVIVEKEAVGGVTTNYANTFDPVDNNLLPAGPVCFYEAGLVGTNLYPNSGASVKGLPPNGLITSLADNVTTFQFGPYAGSNVLYLTASAPSGTLVFNSTTACKSLSILAASAQGGGTGALVIQFADGSSSTNISFSAPEYLVTNVGGTGAAITNFGLVAVGALNEFYTLDPIDNSYPYPTLYQTNINLHSLGYDTKLISSVSFTLPPLNGPAFTTNSSTGIFALSGTQAPYTGNYSINVSASPTGSGIVSGAGSFAAGSTNTVTATANAGYTFANWTQGGVVVSTSPNYTFIVNGGGTLVANFNAPQFSLVASSSPADGGSVSGGGIYPAGSLQTLTATPAGNFEFIGWTGDATGTNNPLNVAVYTNLNITANFATLATNITLTLTTNNSLGRVTPNPNGRTFRKNQNYTLTAVATAGNLFSNWTGSVTTNKNPLTIKLDSSKVIQANFIPNPFIPAKGTYNGLFTAANAVITEQTAGMLKGLAISQSGAYSGTLMINGAGHGLIGKFGLDRQATNKIPRAATQGGNLIVQLTLVPGNPPQVTGTISGTNWISTNLIADLASNIPGSSEYTINIPPDTNNPASNSIPGGFGYALVTNHTGAVRITGALADGTAFSQSVPASLAGDVPVYASLYGNKGLLLGWINLNASNAPGSLAWIHTNARTGLFTNAFTSTNPIALSLWTNSPAKTVLPTNIFAIEITNGVAALTNTCVITFSNNYKLGEVSGPVPLSGSINPKTGQFTITFGASGQKYSSYGAILPNETNGGSYFITKTNSGAIKWGP